MSLFLALLALRLLSLISKCSTICKKNGCIICVLNFGKQVNAVVKSTLYHHLRSIAKIKPPVCSQWKVWINAFISCRLDYYKSHFLSFSPLFSLVILSSRHSNKLFSSSRRTSLYGFLFVCLHFLHCCSSKLFLKNKPKLPRRGQHVWLQDRIVWGKAKTEKNKQGSKWGR